MGKRLVPDEKGRLPLSPKTRELYERIAPRLYDWRDWEWLFAESGEPRGTLQARIHQMVDRGWLEKDKMRNKDTGRIRQYFIVPIHERLIFCGECGTWKPGQDTYLCGDCAALA